MKLLSQCIMAQFKTQKFTLLTPRTVILIKIAEFAIILELSG